MNYGLTLVTAPAIEPVTPGEAASQVRVASEGGYYDEELGRLIKAATREVERLTSRQIINATWDLKLDRFPCGYDSRIFIPKAPLSSVTSITYTDAAGDSQTLATSVYKVITSREPGEIHLKYGQSWPTTYSEAEVVTVRFVAGYGATVSAVPEGIRQAILLLVDHWFENRGAVPVGSISKDMEFSLMSLLASHAVGDEFHAYAG